MMHPSTGRALRVRALRAAGFLDEWAAHLQEQFRNQNIDTYPSDFDAWADDATMTVKQNDLRKLLIGIHQHRIELRKFGK